LADHEQCKLWSLLMQYVILTCEGCEVRKIGPQTVLCIGLQC